MPLNMLKKVITDRVWVHLNQVGKNLSDYQFVFRAGRLVMNTIDRVIIDWLFLQYRKEVRGQELYREWKRQTPR